MEAVPDLCLKQTVGAACVNGLRLGQAVRRLERGRRREGCRRRVQYPAVSSARSTAMMLTANTMMRPERIP